MILLNDEVVIFPDVTDDLFPLKNLHFVRYTARTSKKKSSNYTLIQRDKFLALKIGKLGYLPRIMRRF